MKPQASSATHSESATPPTAPPLTLEQWTLLWRLNPKLFDIFADLSARLVAWERESEHLEGQ